MKKILGLLLIAVMSCLVIQAKKPQAKIEFAEKTFDFSTIADTAPVSHTFVFTNTGDGNLVITDATADCGCTKPEFSETPVAPGKTGKVKVTFNPRYRYGPFSKVITVRSNASNRKATLKITGVVKKAQ